MSSYTDLRSLIISNIKANNKSEITGPILQNVLLRMLENSSQVEEITHSGLKELRDSAELTPSRLYRITDYVTTTTQADTQSAGHPFDVIVLALSESELSEQAWAIQSARDTGGYFADSKLSAWQIWYCIDNDTSLFGWADATNGKGVIYRMIDERNNDCPYDFKNIIFKHPNYPTTYPDYYYTFFSVGDSGTLDQSQYPTCRDNIIREYSLLAKRYLNASVFLLGESYSLCVENILGPNCARISMGGDCSRNRLGGACTDIHFGDECSNNELGEHCYNNTFGNECSNNTLGPGCYDNTFGVQCSYNSLGNGCSAIAMGKTSEGNVFGGLCIDIVAGNSFRFNQLASGCKGFVFGQSCNSNIFGSTCKSNTFGNYCNSNYFGAKCQYNAFGNHAVGLNFGNSCSYISTRFGADKTSNLRAYVNSVSVASGCSYIILWNATTASLSTRIQNLKVAQGVSGTDSSDLSINVETLGNNYETEIAKDSSENVKQFCIADIIL